MTFINQLKSTFVATPEAQKLDVDYMSFHQSAKIHFRCNQVLASGEPQSIELSSIS